VAPVPKSWSCRCSPRLAGQPLIQVEFY